MSLDWRAIPLFLMFACFAFSHARVADDPPRGPVKVIFDTDMDSDCDDVAGGEGCCHCIVGEARQL